MKNKFTNNFRHALKALMLVMMTGFFALSAAAQEYDIEVLDTTDPENGYYPYSSYGIKYEATGFPAGSQYYVYINRGEGESNDLDAGDLLIGQSSNASDSLGFTIPAELEDDEWTVRIAVTNGEDLPAANMVSENYIDNSQVTLSGGSNARSIYMGGVGPRTAVLPSQDLSDEDFVTFVVDLDATNITGGNAVRFSYSVDDGENYTAITDIAGTSLFADTANLFYFQLPEAALVESVFFRAFQLGSDTLENDEEFFQIDELSFRTSNTASIQFDDDFADEFSVQSPEISIDNIVLADTVGEDFGTDYEAFGFTTGATFYLYLTDESTTPENSDSSDDRFLDGEVFATSTDLSGTFEATFPLRDGNSYDLRIAGVYGNIETPYIEYDETQVAVLGTTDTDFGYYFDQNGTRSLRMNAVDLEGESFATLNINFYDQDYLNSDNGLLIQYSLNGSTWVTMDSIVDEVPEDLYTYNIPQAARTSSTQFRIRQKSTDNGSNNQWAVSEVFVKLFDVADDRYVGYMDVNNWALLITDVMDADGSTLNTNDSFYPGDSITITLEANGFDAADSTFTVFLVNNDTDEIFFLDGAVLTEEEGVITIGGFVPTDIDYTNSDGEYSLYVRMISGEEASFGFDVDFFNDFEDAEFTVSGGAFDGSEINFESAGDRSVTLPAIEIPSMNEIELYFDLDRLNNVRSSSGTELVLEYSTDGSTFTIIDTYSLNALTEDFYLYEDDLPAAIVSESTTFRFRQLSNSGSGLDTWRLDDVEITGEGNLIDLSYLDYHDDYDHDGPTPFSRYYVMSPSISISNYDDGGADLYPGTEFTVDFSIDNGEFPEGTEFTLYVDRDYFPIELGSLTAPADGEVGTYTATIPSLVPGTDYSIIVKSSFGEIESNTLPLEVIQIAINNIDITTEDGEMDGDDVVIYPGATVDISYTVVGPLGDGVTATLYVVDYGQKNPKGAFNGEEEENDLVVLTSGEAADGTISATLPLGINYGESPEFVLNLVNGNLESLASEEIEVSSTTDLSNYFYEYSGATNSGGVYFGYNTYNTSEVITEAYNLSDATSAKIYFNIEVEDYDDMDHEVFVDYSLDGGDTWVNITSGLINEDSYDDDLFDWIDVPEAAMTEETHFRFIWNEDEEYIDDAYFYFYGFEIAVIEEEPIAEAEFYLSDFDIYLESLSISVSDLEEAEYQLGEEFTVTYDAAGPFPSDVTFAVVLTQENERDLSGPMEEEGEDVFEILGESSESGVNSITVNFPSQVLGDSDESYMLSVVPYIKAFDGDVYRPKQAETDLDYIDEDFEYKGGYELEVNGGGIRFDEIGERYALTRALDLSATDTATLEFSFIYYDDEPSTALVLPLLQVSIDGGATFETLEVEGSDSFDPGYLYWTSEGSYQVGIPSEYLTEATHFRWFQALNRGEDQNEWSISNVSVSEGESNSYSSSFWNEGPNQEQYIYALVPDVDDFVWEQANTNEAIFNGSTFEYLWTIDSTELEASTFPEGTVFDFSISFTDPATDEDLIIASTTTYGVQDATIPAYVTSDDYSIYLTAYAEIDGEVIEFADEEWVGSIDVFNRAILLTSSADEGTVLYAGSTVTFNVSVENETSALDATKLYSNILWDGNVIASKQGFGDITFDLPPFINGSETWFDVEVSEGGPVSDLLTSPDDNDLSDLEEDIDNFSNTSYVTVEDGEFYSEYEDDYDVIEFNNPAGRQVLTTRDFEVGELTNTTLLVIDTYFDVDMDDLLESQYMIFEYSTDGGVTYMSLDTLNDYVSEDLSYTVTEAMKSNNTRFRWRQEESYGTFVLYDVSFNYAASLPFDYSGTYLDINRQAVIVSTSQTENCPDGEVTLDYEIRGRFGADTEIYVSWDNGDDDGTFDEYFTGITEGTGSISVMVPRTLVDDNEFDGAQENNIDFTFSLEAYDPTYEEDFDDYSRYSVASEPVEMVAAIAKANNRGMTGNDVSECDPAASVYVSNPQMYFLYEVLNADTVFASLEYDGETSEIELGDLTEDVELTLRVTSMSETGVTCNVYTFTESVTLEVEPKDLLLRKRYTTSSTVEVTAGESKVICAGDVNTVVLSLASYDADDSEVEWFRDDLNTPVLATGNTFTNFAVSGAYFARITDGECSYVTESMNVEVVEKPETPEISIVSNTLTCGDGEVVLAAPVGYAYYSWSNGMETDTITVEDGGSFTVRVSNYPFSSSVCASSYSEAVVIESNDYREYVATTNNLTNGVIAEGQTLTGCGSVYVAFYEVDNMTGGNLIISRDGKVVDTRTGTFAYGINFDESGVYSATWRSADITNTCTSSTVSFNLVINEQPDMPAITASGSTSFCEGGSVTLSAPAGYAYYKWTRNYAEAGTTETLFVDVDGDYRVQVSNAPLGEGCLSTYSEAVTVNVYEEMTPKISGYEDGDVIDVCSNTNFSLGINNYSGSPTFTWYRDGVVIPNNNFATRNVKASGTFYAELSYGNNDTKLDAPCVFTTPSVTVNYETVPDAVQITEPSQTDFCVGEVDLTLTATPGAAFYTWYRAGNKVGSTSASNTLTINASGTYTVKASASVDGCESARSNQVVITTTNLAQAYYGVSTLGADCSTGDVIVQMSGSSANEIYQLLDAATGAALGSPMIGTGSVVRTTISGLTEPTPLLIEASYLTGAGCSDVSISPRGTATPNYVELEIKGTTVTANVYGSYSDIAWFRNGTLMRTATGTSIDILDAATYSVEVTFIDGCVFTSSTISAGVSTARTATAANGRMIANTFPNPTSSSVNLDVPGESMGVYSVQIMTLSGQVVLSGVFEKTAADHVENINISDLEAGIYNMVVVKGKQVENIRIVKQ